MAGRILNRRELRKQADEAEARESPQDSEANDEDDEVEDTGDAGVDEDEGPGADTEDGADDESPRPAKKPAKAKAPAAKAKAPAAKPRKPRKPKAAPRMRARWGVFDAAMRLVAIFDYNQRAAADEKAAELAAKKNGSFFLQLVKESMPELAPGDAPSPQAK
jgi:hypothetical protein